MSLFGRTGKVKNGVCVRNVKGSSNDPRAIVPNKGRVGWLRLLKIKAGIQDPKLAPLCACCDEKRTAEVGAHVVFGDGLMDTDAPDQMENLRGSSRVFIIPLCKECNQQREPLTIQRDTIAARLLLFMEDEVFDESAVAANFSFSDEKVKKLIREGREIHADYIVEKVSQSQRLSEEDAAFFNPEPLNLSEFELKRIKGIIRRAKRSRSDINKDSNESKWGNKTYSATRFNDFVREEDEIDEEELERQSIQDPSYRPRRSRRSKSKRSNDIRINSLNTSGSEIAMNRRNIIARARGKDRKNMDEDLDTAWLESDTEMELSLERESIPIDQVRKETRPFYIKDMQADYDNNFSNVARNTQTMTYNAH